jgi:tryptophan-rich sensory protein
MDYTALFKALAICLASILFEAAGTTRDGKVWFESLKKPPYSLPFKIWYIVGGLYYIICGTIAYRLFANSSDLSAEIILLAIMMLLNGAGNFLLFRLRSLKAFHLCMYPFTLLTLTLYILLLRKDTVSSWILLLYLIWLIYDFYYLYALWKTNKK